MAKREIDSEVEVHGGGVNPGYASFQIAKALTTAQEHDDPATRKRAEERIAKWKTVLGNILVGSVAYGSRTPVDGVPGWATLAVVTGGFATGELLAGGPLQDHERDLLKNLPPCRQGDERRCLNAHFLTDSGLAELQERLRSGCYDVGVPEEGALMVVAWLVENGRHEEARALLEELSPYFTKLRFYPIPRETPRRFGSRVHLQDVKRTISDLRKIGPNQHVLAQKEAVEVWAPFWDRLVGVFMETVEGDWPCRVYPSGWQKRASDLLDEYTTLRRKHRLCGKPERPKEHFAQLRALLVRCVDDPGSLTGKDVGRIRLILERYVEKRGDPGSAKCAELRQRQRADVSGPTFQEIARVVIPRLEKHTRDDGLDDVGHLGQDVSQEESSTFSLPEGTTVPNCIQRKVERCLNETVQVLVERGLITSGETLARVLPQMTSRLRAVGITDPLLRPLYAAIYRAFRQRRSLLLLNLESQVQIEELPWISAIEQFRSDDLSSRELARQALEEVVLLVLTSFPHVILPNKLLQELRALVKGADLDLPLVDEVAADIFMGEFSGKFLDAAKRAADLLDGTLYASYYGIDYAEVRRIPEVKQRRTRTWFSQSPAAQEDGFVHLCASRAGVSLGTWDPATNGMIIEQQQILTTQNLAVLTAGLGVVGTLQAQVGEMARQCFSWICRRQQMKIDGWHARLIALKNTAYAWRQMVFYLSLVPNEESIGFLRWAEDYLDKQQEGFRNRFRPALKGLAVAAEGGSLDSTSARRSGARRFLGWSKKKHWLLRDA